MAREFLTPILLPQQTFTSIGVTMSTARLLGRTTAGTGAPQEISVGSGLSLSGGVLSATGGGSSTSAGANLYLNANFI